jgi:brefeldin A-inhibited guanine nucleotide-exchange protein
LEIIQQYNTFDNDSKQRNISAWRPVVVVILTAFSKFNDEMFKLHIQDFYPSAIKLLLNDMTPDVRVAVYNILLRSGRLFKLISDKDNTELINESVIKTTQDKEEQPSG